MDGSPAPYIHRQSNSNLMQNIIRVHKYSDNEKQTNKKIQSVFILYHVIMWIHNVDICRTCGSLQQPVTVAEIRLKVAAVEMQISHPCCCCGTPTRGQHDVILSPFPQLQWLKTQAARKHKLCSNVKPVKVSYGCLFGLKRVTSCPDLLVGQCQQKNRD